MTRVASFGTWVSPLSAAEVARGGLRLGVVALDGDDIYWLEGRPNEGGRYALMRRTPDGRIAEATPPEINVRSRVHEYGGDAYLVSRGVIYCVNFADQRIYRIGRPTTVVEQAREKAIERDLAPQAMQINGVATRPFEQACFEGGP